MNSTTGQLDAVLARMDYGRAFREAITMTDPQRPSTEYAQPLLDAVAMFEELGIGYALIGGVAAMYYGRSRSTEDVDFVAATKHAEVLAAHAETMAKHHFDPACSWKLYHQSGVEVDLWKDEHADEIVQRAVTVGMAGRSVLVAEPHDLIAMKLRAGRLQDDYDIGQMLSATAIDENRVRDLVTPEQFAHFLDVKKRA
ncbi:MAG: nucleotidyltransferase [Phycisphaerae bacterium]|nr:nucleotidyltransferase [Phycisphaerae bacterium]